MNIKEICINTRNLVDSAQDRDYWRTLVNTTLNLRVSQAMEIIKATGKRPLGRPRSRWEGNIRMNLKEIYINTRNWVDSAQDRDYWRALVNAALNLRVLLAMELLILWNILCVF